MKNPEIYAVYPFYFIEEWAAENNLEIKELGNGLIGETFLVLLNRANQDEVTSFILDSATQPHFYYRCVYSDRNLRCALLNPNNF